MKISNNINSLSFQKTLVAKGAYLDKGKSKPCYFYKLDPKKDKNYFTKLSLNPNWKDSVLLSHFKYDFGQDSEALKSEKLCWFIFKNSKIYNPEVSSDLDGFYTMETRTKKCLGLAEIMLSGVEYLETCPKYAHKTKSIDKKYIGESMLSFITKLTAKAQKNYVVIPTTLTDANNFYKEKCHFKEEGGRSSAFYLEEKDFNKLTEQNKIHTKSEIKLVNKE